jgi:hypothetical protein
VVFKLNVRSNTGSAAPSFFFFLSSVFFVFFFSFCAFIFISVVVGKESAPQTFFYVFLLVSSTGLRRCQGEFRVRYPFEVSSGGEIVL